MGKKKSRKIRRLHRLKNRLDNCKSPSQQPIQEPSPLAPVRESTKTRANAAMIEIVQFGQPHSIFHIGRRIKLLQEEIPNELLQGPDTQNIILFEEAVNFTEEEAEEFSQVIRNGARFIDKLLGHAWSTTDKLEIDNQVFGSIAMPQLKEGQHSSLMMSFFDWLLQKYRKKGVNLDLIPETAFSGQNKTNKKSQLKNLLGDGSLDARQLDELHEEKKAFMREFKEYLLERDRAIAAYLQEKLGPMHTQDEIRTKVIITIGSEHNRIKSSMEPDFASKVPFREDIEPPYLELDPNQLSREQFARLYCFTGIYDTLEEIYLKLNAGTIMKEPKKDSDGKDLFEYTFDICQSLPIEAIYMLLQEYFGVDCGLDKSKYPQIDLPAPLSAREDVVTAFVKDWGSNDLSNTEIGTFIDRMTVERAIFITFAETDPIFRDAIRKLVETLPLNEIKILKQELVRELVSRGSFRSRALPGLMQNIFDGKVRGINTRTLKTLQKFMRTNPKFILD